MWLTDLLERNCQQRPDQLAVVDADRRLTWTDLASRSSALAGYLAARGVRHGDRVGVLSRNRLEVLESYFAIARLGAAFVPLNHALTPDELSEVVRTVGIHTVLGEGDLLLSDWDGIDFEGEDYRQAVQKGPPTDREDAAGELDDPMAILLTSATTGRPKAVVQTHAQMMHMSLGWLAAVQPDSEIKLLNLTPLSHGSIQVTLTYLAAGATIVLLRTFTPQRALAEIERQQITDVFLVPQMLSFMLGSRAFNTTDLGSLREVTHGAAPMPAPLLTEAVSRLPCRLRNAYGMTEAGGPFATVSTDDLDPGTGSWPAGRGIPGLVLGVFDEDGTQLPAGKLGEVCLRGRGVMRGYWNDEVATAEVIRDGWLRTGDLGDIDADGYIRLVDRRKDMLIRGGQNVYPAEIERVLLELEDITDAAVIGVPDETWGEVPIAYIVEGGTGDVAVRATAHLRGRVASYKVPQRILVIDEVPRNGAGKTLKRVLRERYTADLEGTQ